MASDRWIERLPEQAAQIVETLQHQRHSLEQRGAQLKRELEERRDALAEQLKLQSVGRALELGAGVLGTLGERIQEVHERSPVQWDRIEQGVSVITERAQSLAERRASLERPAIPGYDDLNVAQVNAALATLSRHELHKLADYERAHKNRVTVLREVERRLSAD